MSSYNKIIDAIKNGEFIDLLEGKNNYRYESKLCNGPTDPLMILDMIYRVYSEEKRLDVFDVLLQMLSREAMIYYCPCKDSNSFKEVIIDKNKYVVIATSKEALSISSEYLEISEGTNIDAIEVIKDILKDEKRGMVINLGDVSQLILDNNMVRYLYKEIIVMDLYMKGGAYIIQSNKDYHLIQLNGNKLLNVALEKNEASEFKKKFNLEGSVVFKSLKEILYYFKICECKALVYYFNNDNIVLIEDPYLAWLYNSPF